MADTITKVADLIDPQVMADMITAKLASKIKITPFAKIDHTLVGRPGDEITVPKFAYIGDAEDVAEGVAIGVTKLTASSTKVKVKKVGKAVEISDESALSAFGDPIGTATNQIVMAIASKIDNDGMAELLKASMIYDGTANTISYTGIVTAIDLFEEEDQAPKIMYINPKQVTQLRLDPDFRDINKYPLQTLMTGVIGEIAGCQIIPSKKVALKANTYSCPIIKTVADADIDDETSALTIYLKREVEVEPVRNGLTKTTTITADKHCVVSLSDDSKVVLAKFKSTPPTTTA